MGFSKNVSCNNRMRTLCLKRVFFAFLGAVLCGFLVGCSSNNASTAQTSSKESSVFVYGTTGYGVQMDDVGLNPHHTYSGWSAVRYGVAETLFRFSDSMEIEPWLASSYTYVDDKTLEIVLKEDIKFSSGRSLDAVAVKECFEALMRDHDRAPRDMKISHIDAQNNRMVIHTTEPCPSLINYLCDPYTALIDMQYGVQADGNVAGTGPYKAYAISDTEISLGKNEAYWAGMPEIDTIIVRAFSDTQTLQSALQSGEIDATYGLAYASYPLFENQAYRINDCFTTRSFFGQMNYRSEILQEKAVREAIVRSIDKESFVKKLLNGRGEMAIGPFPAQLPFGDQGLRPLDFNLDYARQLLDEAGWNQFGNDGIRQKDGKRLHIRWLSYPGRLELPLLAEAVQATLKQVGIEVELIVSANHTELRKDVSSWDIYASSLTTAPTGDPEYFFASTCLPESTKNFGGYINNELIQDYSRLSTTFDKQERSALATSMSQHLVDDAGYFFVSFLQMGIVTKANISGIIPHTCDYYEITHNLKMG